MRYRIADNKVAEASSWNDDVLRAEMDALKALDVDLTDTGFSEVELDGLLREVEDLQGCRAFFDAGRGSIPGKIKRCLCQ